MSEIKRYAPVWAPPDEMIEDTQGEWVRWEDVQQYIPEEVLSINELGNKKVFFTENGVYISNE
jgi:hypothetical protein